MPDGGGVGVEGKHTPLVMAEPCRDLRWWLSQFSLRVQGALGDDW